jgi:DNA-binding transcriptional MerR regulator
MPTEQVYSIGELADLAGVTPRTIRYYVSIGLLPSPEQAGPKTRYTDGHLQRLRLVRHLQRQHLPLGEIGDRIAQLDDEAVEAALDADVVARPADSALDYILQLQGDQGDQALGQTNSKENNPKEFWAGAQRPAEQRQLDPKAQLDTRTRWERVPLSESVELHVRHPMDRRKRQQIEHYIRLGREMLEEGDR